MSKRTKKNTPKCDRYIFSLKPMQNQCKLSQTTSVSFCDPSKHRRQKLSIGQKEEDCLDCPVFNKDNNFATPTFILQSEKVQTSSTLVTFWTARRKNAYWTSEENDRIHWWKRLIGNWFFNFRISPNLDRKTASVTYVARPMKTTLAYFL